MLEVTPAGPGSRVGCTGGIWLKAPNGRTAATAIVIPRVGLDDTLSCVHYYGTRDLNYGTRDFNPSIGLVSGSVLKVR